MNFIELINTRSIGFNFKYALLKAFEEDLHLAIEFQDQGNKLQNH